MKVALDVSSLDHRQISGAGIYTLELLKALKKRPSLDVTPFWRFSRWKHREQYRHHVGQARPWLFGIGSNAELVHGPDFRVVPAPGRKRIVSVLDLAFLQEGMTSPEFSEKKRRDLDQMLERQPPDAIIAISEATKKDVLDRYPQFKGRVHVTYLGGDHLTVNQAQTSETLTPQFLFVGNLEARKNVLGILRAFEIHAQRPGGQKTRLVLIGKPGFNGQEILKAAEVSPVRERVELLGYCSAEDLRRHYARSLALVYPSWIEGFGIPVVEAMMAGLPVITSSTTSTAEILGSEGWLVDPADSQAIANAMDQALELSGKSEERKALIERAKARARLFTWDACAESTVKVYDRVLSK